MLSVGIQCSSGNGEPFIHCVQEVSTQLFWPVFIKFWPGYRVLCFLVMFLKVCSAWVLPVSRTYQLMFVYKAWHLRKSQVRCIVSAGYECKVCRCESPYI